MSELISLRAYARSRSARGLPGGTLKAVQKAAESGRIRLIEGKIDAEIADMQWERNTNPDQQKRGAGGSLGEPLQPAPGEPIPPAAAPRVQASAPERPPVSEDQLNRIREAARADAARAELLHFELEEKRGNLVRADDVRRAAMEKARVARDALLGIPDRLAPLLAAETDVAKVHSLLVQETRRICSELAVGEDKPTRQ